MEFEKAIMAGTFDHFHPGHQAILNCAFAAAKYVFIGITSDAFVGQFKNLEQKYPLAIEKFADRQSSLVEFLREKQYFQRANVLPIEDKYDRSISDSTFEAIVVSPETEAVAREINQIRRKHGLIKLEIVLQPWILAEDGKPINSLRIRNGDIDRRGKLFTIPASWGVRILPQNLRQEFKKPSGELFPDGSKNHKEGVVEFAKRYLGGSPNRRSKPETGHSVFGGKKYQPKIIAVGDGTTAALISQGIFPDISIIDFKIKRIPVYKNIAELGLRDIKVHEKAVNAAGTINIDAFQKLNSLIKNEVSRVVLQIDGEDDLMALCACYLSPLNYLIVYGQPEEGIVVIEVTDEVKQKAKEQLEKFEKE